MDGFNGRDGGKVTRIVMAGCTGFHLCTHGSNPCSRRSTAVNSSVHSEAHQSGAGAGARQRIHRHRERESPEKPSVDGGSGRRGRWGGRYAKARSGQGLDDRSQVCGSTGKYVRATIDKSKSSASGVETFSLARTAVPDIVLERDVRLDAKKRATLTRAEFGHYHRMLQTMGPSPWKRASWFHGPS